ncbi:MAG: hypothetical protein U0V70_00970 [Terriglobia bacterium]
MNTIRKIVNWLAGVKTWKVTARQPQESPKNLDRSEGRKLKSMLFTFGAVNLTEENNSGKLGEWAMIVK